MLVARTSLFSFWLPLLGLMTMLSACSHGNLYREVDFQEAAAVSTTSCDVKALALKKEIATALDERAVQLAALKSAGSDSPVESYLLGPLTLLHTAVPVSTQASNEDMAKDWGSLYSRYLSLKQKSVGQEWKKFDRDVKSILVDDRGRRFWPDRNRVTMKDKLRLESSFRKIALCLNDPACSSVSFSVEETDFFMGKDGYSSKLEHIAGEAEPVRRRALYLSLKNQVSSDFHSRFGFYRNASVIRQNESTLILPLDPGPFEAVEGFLGMLIEERWSNSKMHLKIQWQKSTYFKPVYKLTIDPDPNTRDFVNGYQDQVVSLHSVEYDKTIVHEIGHVLGFPDFYYTDFDEKNCKYAVSLNQDDIMSDGEHPTAEEFMLLDVNYQSPSAASIHR